MFKKKKKINYLELTPYRKLSFEETEEGLIDVLVPRFKNEFLKKLLSPRRGTPFIKANLDEIGSVTWKLIDGDSNVTIIAEKLTEHFGEKIHPVYDRLTAFLTQLYNNGFISFNEFERK